MDVDIIIGSAENKNRLMQKYRLNPFLILTSSSLAAIEQILAKTNAGNRLRHLRIFTFSNFIPAAQLARLAGSFLPHGRLEIFFRFPNQGAGGSNFANNPSGGFAGNPSTMNFQGGGFQGNLGGGFSGNSSVAGIGGGFQGISGASGNTNQAAEARHLSNLLKVPVSFFDL